VPASAVGLHTFGSEKVAFPVYVGSRRSGLGSESAAAGSVTSCSSCWFGRSLAGCLSPGSSGPEDFASLPERPPTLRYGPSLTSE
jgi:hypothetical protein